MNQLTRPAGFGPGANDGITVLDSMTAGSVDPIGFLTYPTHLVPQRALLLLHAPVTHRLVLRSIRLDLRAVHRHLAQLHQTSRLA